MNDSLAKKLLFLTGTRADFGKIKSLIQKVEITPGFDFEIFVTGMHMLKKYGHTVIEVERIFKEKMFCFINQNEDDSMDQVLAKTILGMSDFVKNNRPDLIIVHGDRVEALAGALVGALSNIRVAHIEGGEVSGTIDESIRHAISKIAHVHFVANDTAKNRLLQLGEASDAIFVIGSPDIDIMNSATLPKVDEVQRKYEIEFSDYGIILFHPVTTEYDHIGEHADNLVEAAILSKMNFVVIYPNNDHGSEKIINAYRKIKSHANFRVFPSMRFEYFLTLMKNSKLILGNSSAGIREAPHFGIPTINIGTRQNLRAESESIFHVDCNIREIAKMIATAKELRFQPKELFGSGNSCELFLNAILEEKLWKINIQKHFIDHKSKD